MIAKHLSKFSISKKIVLFCAIISVAIISSLSLFSVGQTNAFGNSSNDDAFDSTFTLPKGVSGTYVEWNDDAFGTWNSGYTLGRLVEQCGRPLSLPPKIVMYQGKNDFGHNGSFLYILLGVHDHLIIFNNDSDPNSYWSFASGEIVSFDSVKMDDFDSGTRKDLIFYSSAVTEINIKGHVANANDAWQPVPGAFVQYCHWTPWGSVPVEGMNTFTDWFGNYTIEGIEEDMLPGVIRVYRFGYEVGESWPIWGVPEGEDTIYRFIEMAPSEPPVPPVPPTPPDPPVPPVPPTPPVPPQPVPPTPVPTPDNPGGGIAQTSDTTPFGAIAVFAVVAALGCGVALRKEYF